MYEPQEDSFLLLKHIRHYSHGHVLDMGTGSGILAIEAAKYSENVVAVDIDNNTIVQLKKDVHNKKITFIVSDLFSNIKDKFDLIIFNPPYLPSTNIKHTDLDGSRNGTEIIEKFLKQAKKYMKDDGKILLLTSSLNKGIENMFKKHDYRYKKIDEAPLFFERLYVYELCI